MTPAWVSLHYTLIISYHSDDATTTGAQLVWNWQALSMDYVDYLTTVTSFYDMHQLLCSLLSCRLAYSDVVMHVNIFAQIKVRRRGVMLA